MADGSIIIEVKGDAEELERALKNVSRSADTLEDAVKDVASAFKKVESAADDVDGDGLKDAARDADKLDRELDDAAQSAGKLGDKLGSGFTVAKGALASLAAEGVQMVISGLADLAGEAITAADSLTKFESTMEFAGFGAQEIDALTQSVQDYASKTVYDLETVANTTAQLGANGVKDFMALTEAAGNLNAVAGGNADTFKSVSMVLTQTAGAGKLTTENWNQLADAIPGASGVLQEAMKKNGAYTGDFRDAMAAGEITAEEFNQAIMGLGFEEAAIEAASSTKTIEGAFGNLKATVVDGFVAALTDGGLMNGITGFINGVATILSNAGQYIGPAMDSIKGSIQGVKDAFANAFTGEQQAAILDFLSTFASALVALPFQVVAVGVEIITTAFELLITASGAVVDFFTVTLPDAFSSISTAVSEVVPSLNDFSSYFEEMRQSISEKMDAAKEAVGKAIERIRDHLKLSDAAKSVGEIFKDIQKSVSDKIDAAKEAVEKAVKSVRDFLSFDGLSNTVSGIFDSVKTSISTKIESARETVSGAAERIKNFLSFSGLSATVDGVFESIKTGISDKINAARDAVQRAIDKIKSIMNFSWSLPPLKVPDIRVTGGVAPFGIGGKGSLPKFSIAWHAKGGVMKSPTIFGVAGNTLLGGGEAGPEAIAPIKVLQKYIKDAVSGSMSEFVGRLKRAVESETVSISSALGSRVGESGGVSNHYGGTSINVYVSGGTNNPEQARNTGREIGAETAREMRRRGLVPV